MNTMNCNEGRTVRLNADKSNAREVLALTHPESASEFTRMLRAGTITPAGLVNIVDLIVNCHTPWNPPHCDFNIYHGGPIEYQGRRLRAGGDCAHV